MKIPDDTLWKCPRCETLNRGTDRCRICGFSADSQPGRRNNPGSAPHDPPDHNRGLRIAIVVSLIVLAVVVIAGFSYYCFSGYH